jgi:hypothetical protein
MLQESRKKINNIKLTRILKKDEKIELSLFIQRNQKIIKKSETKKLIEINRNRDKELDWNHHTKEEKAKTNEKDEEINRD